MIVMSPFKIFNNSGNSSKLVFRNQLPNEVFLSSSGKRFPSESVLLVIVLNFNKLKERPFKVERSCIKKIGDPNLNRITTIRTKYMGIKATMPNNDKIKSIILFIYLYIILLYIKTYSDYFFSLSLFFTKVPKLTIWLFSLISIPVLIIRAGFPAIRQ